MPKEQTGFAVQYARKCALQFLRGTSLIEWAEPKRGERLVDLGCGTGQLTYVLARRVSPEGVVFAVDTDAARLELAKQAMPEDIDNIIFLEAAAENLSAIGHESIDLVYSNYVLQWIPDKKAVLAEVNRCLRPGGRFVMEAVGRLSPFLREVSRMAEKPEKPLVDLFFCLSEDAWITLFEQSNLIVERSGWPSVAFEFPDVDDFLDWWEGTTHGKFQRRRIPADGLWKLKQRFPDRVCFGGDAFQGIVRKPD